VTIGLGRCGTCAASLAGYSVVDDLGENDRSATGYLPKQEFEATADAFYARPQESVRGWERAADAQARIVRAVDQIVSQTPAEGDVAIVGHGAPERCQRSARSGTGIAGTAAIDDSGSHPDHPEVSYRPEERRIMLRTIVYPN
jgi:broad specificity phosphatase PhoE